MRPKANLLPFFEEWKRKQGGESGETYSKSVTKKQPPNPPTPCSQFPLWLGPSRAHSAAAIQCFSSLLTDYISTLHSVPFNYKQEQHLTKVSLTAAVRGSGSFTCECEGRDIWQRGNTATWDNTGQRKELLIEAGLRTRVHSRCISNSQQFNLEPTNPAGPHTSLANISINAWMWGNEGLVVACIKKPKAMWDVWALIVEKKNGTKKTFCNPKSQWEIVTVDYWQVMGSLKLCFTSKNLSSFDGLKIQVSHDWLFGERELTVCEAKR